jgi:ribose transport system substrate-binding protein
MKNWIRCACIITGLLLAGCGSGDNAGGNAPSSDSAPAQTEERIRVAYVTNGVLPFWIIAEAGAKAGAKEFDVDCEVLMPPKGIVDQKRMIETALVNGIDGIAISPIDAANQVDFINQAAAVTNVITQDSDAPNSNRLCFIGMDNYQAGRSAGKLIKEAIPDGGKVMIFVGRLEQLNAKQRRQGVIDELLDRPTQPFGVEKFDPPAATPSNEKYSIIGTRTDNFDTAKAKSNAEDTIAATPDIACMVGLFAYNVPACLTAVREAGKLDSIKIVAFDEDDATLQGIIDGEIHGTICQQPYEYGRQSVEILAALARGDRSVLPENGFREVPSVIVKQHNAEEFWANLKKLKGE